MHRHIRGCIRHAETPAWPSMFFSGRQEVKKEGFSGLCGKKRCQASSTSAVNRYSSDNAKGLGTSGRSLRKKSQTQFSNPVFYSCSVCRTSWTDVLCMLLFMSSRERNPRARAVESCWKWIALLSSLLSHEEMLDFSGTQGPKLLKKF